jgi:hypothetical protein
VAWCWNLCHNPAQHMQSQIPHALTFHETQIVLSYLFEVFLQIVQRERIWYRYRDCHSDGRTSPTCVPRSHCDLLFSSRTPRLWGCAAQLPLAGILCSDPSVLELPIVVSRCNKFTNSFIVPIYAFHCPRIPRVKIAVMYRKGPSTWLYFPPPSPSGLPCSRPRWRRLQCFNLKKND